MAPGGAHGAYPAAFQGNPAWRDDSPLLRDSIYVDGRFWTRYAGAQIEMKPVEVSDPLPREIFADNQTFLDLADGVAIRARIGTFAFKRRVFCGACGGELVPRFVGERAVYYHQETGAISACLGLAIDVATLDPLVIRQLRRLETCAEHRRDAFDRAVAWREAEEDEDEVPYARLPELESALADLRDQLATIARSISDDPRLAGTASGGEASHVVAEVLLSRGAVELSDEIERLSRAVSVAGPIADHRSRRHPRIAKIGPDMSQAFLELVEEAEPEDLRHLAKRARVLEAAVSRIVVTPVHDGDQRQIQVRVEGARGPRHRELAYPTVPSTAARDVLRDHIQTVKSS